MKQFLLASALIFVLVFAIVGCAIGPGADPNADFKTALQSIDISDGNDGGLGVESLTAYDVTSQGLNNSINGVTWNSCYFDQVVTTVQLAADPTITGDSSANCTVNFTVTGDYHVAIKDSTTTNLQLDKAFSVSGTGTVNFIKNNNGHWKVDSFSASPLTSEPLSPTISEVSFATAEPFQISLQNQTPPFVSQATISCAPMPGVAPLMLFVATRNFGIVWATVGRRAFYDPAGCTSPATCSYACTLLLRPGIRTSTTGAPHFGGIFACELVNTGTVASPVYTIYITIYPGMIKVTP